MSGELIAAHPYLLTLASIAAVHLMAAASPGPAFIMVTRVSIGEGRSAALGAALGVASAALIWAIAATLGMAVLLREAAWLYGALKLAGGLYLLWLGLQAWRHAATPLATMPAGISEMSALRAWWLGLSSNLTNPKVIVFFSSIFVMLFTPQTPGWVRLAALAIVALNEGLWYTLVALLFSSRPAQAGYRKAKAWIDRATGTVMILFGVRLIWDARSS